MISVSSKEECELAATSLGLSDTTAVDSYAPPPGPPHGCIYTSHNWLQWYDPLSTTHTLARCGYYDGLFDYDCLCRKNGKCWYEWFLGYTILDNMASINTWNLCSYAFFLLYIAKTTCQSLHAEYECSSEKGGIVTGAKSLNGCPYSCADAANGLPGCCEWQVDWRKCLFVPHVPFAPSTTSGRVLQYAIDCVSNNAVPGNN